MSTAREIVLEYLNRPLVGACTVDNLDVGTLDLSRSSIRRALRQLEVEGYVVDVGSSRAPRYAPVAKILRRIADHL